MATILFILYIIYNGVEYILSAIGNLHDFLGYISYALLAIFLVAEITILGAAHGVAFKYRTYFGQKKEAEENLNPRKQSE